MDFIKEKIRIMTGKLHEFAELSNTRLKYEFIDGIEYKTTNTPPSPDAPWQVAETPRVFDGVDAHFWIHLTVPALECEDFAEYRLILKTGRENQWDARNPQFIAYVNGESATQAFDVTHVFLPLENGKELDIYIYGYTGMQGGSFPVTISLQKFDLISEALHYDMFVPYELLSEFSENSAEYVRIRNELDKASQLLDLRRPRRDEYRESVKTAIAYLDENLYGREECLRSVVSCIGHTHIDVAWLWSVAQTREKAQRSFSTFINLMKRYPDFLFMSSQPQLYQYVKESDPELFEKIKEAVARGQWEPEGAMWLEADANLASGESLVRQILYGKRFMREEFGVDNKVLWLPDVFGYNGALPQILKKSGVDYFFTTKLNWNESNKMPHDTFVWEGIDGSKVLACFSDSYVLRVNAKTVMSTFRNYKDKAYTDGNILTFGFGDGGGGPTYDMMEKYRRFNRGLPGCPVVKAQKVLDFFKKHEEQFNRSASELGHTPKWVGEMYLEMHRGTYTSIAKNKKNNRRCELLHQKAETLSVSDMILLGGSYPEETLRKNQTTILLNQFHDILPGSSIGPVYDVTDKEYAKILSEGGAIVDEKLARLKSAISTSGGLFVYNPSPFTVSDTVEYGGREVLVESIPAHGWRVIPLDELRDARVKIGERFMENDLISVTFDENYNIVSLYDKQASREVIAQGALANRLEVYEDYPREYDAWEISSYYKQKKWNVDDVSDEKALPNGFEITRKYQSSTIVQKITIRPDSKRIDFATDVDWNEDHVLLKASFPTSVRSHEATYDIQFGSVTRPTVRNTPWDQAKFEVCAHKWADFSEFGYGVSIINDCKYGHSVEDNVMTISLLKAATYPWPMADREKHSFTYSLYPHTGDFREAGTVQQGYAVNMPLEISEIPAQSGSLPDVYSVISCDNPAIVTETIKKAEDDGCVIVRMYESFGGKASARLEIGFDFREVYICDLLENSLERLDSDGRTVDVSLSNFEILTLKFVI